MASSSTGRSFWTATVVFTPPRLQRGPVTAGTWIEVAPALSGIVRLMPLTWALDDSISCNSGPFKYRVRAWSPRRGAWGRSGSRRAKR